MTDLHIVLEGGPLDGGALVLPRPDYPDLLAGLGTRPEDYSSYVAAPGHAFPPDVHTYRLTGVSQAKRHELGHYAYVRPEPA